MAHRIITDRLGQDWDVWEVVPSEVLRRAVRDSSPDGRNRIGIRRDLKLVVGERLRRGWLAFQSRDERRRIFPAPAGWQNLDDAGLLALLFEAEVVRRPKGQVD